MEIETSTFGAQSVNADEVITFSRPMLGLEEFTQFKLFHEQSDMPSVYYLQSITDADLSMSIVAPKTFGFEYNIALSDEEIELLKLDNPADAVVVLAVYKPHEDDKNDEDLNLKVIVKSPIIINTASKLAIQKVIPDLAVKQ